MKNILFSLVISSIMLLLVSCEENSVNNPVSTESVDKVGPHSEKTLRGSITLNHNLEAPGTIKKYLHLSGKIYYSQQLIITDRPDIAPGYDVELDISVDAILKDVNAVNGEQNTWKILAKSEDITFVAINGSSILVKSYPVLGRTDELQLVCTFEITTQGMELKSVALSSPVV